MQSTHAGWQYLVIVACNEYHLSERQELLIHVATFKPTTDATPASQPAIRFIQLMSRFVKLSSLIFLFVVFSLLCPQLQHLDLRQ